MSPTIVSRFTPSLMSPEALEALFVQREELAKRIVELLRESTLTPAKHHSLLIGPRGIGKTHLVALIYHRIEVMGELGDRLLIAWLREDEWGITSFLDLLLCILRALEEKYSSTFPSERLKSLTKMPSKVAEHRAELLLKEFLGHRTLLLIMENLDSIFQGLGEEGQKRFRAYQQDYEFCTILATAQGLFNGVSLRTSPFYGFFRISHLEELMFEDAILLLRNIASFVGNKELASLLQTPLGRARIRAVHHLAGGNHRVYVIFSEFLTRNSLLELVEPFMRTLDDLTPYYQSRMSWLSPQQRKIISFLCDWRSAVTVKEIAKGCFITHQTASSQLKDLKEKGYVRAESVGRESFYELKEPLMRFCLEVKKNRGEPLRLLVDFLRLWYSQAELRQQLETLQPDADLEKKYISHALELSAQEKRDPHLEACLKAYDSYMNAADFTRALEVNDEMLEIDSRDALTWLERALTLSRLKRYKEALSSCDKAIEIDPDMTLNWRIREGVLFDLDRYEEALASVEKWIELSPKDTYPWFRKGVILRMLGRYEEGLTWVEKAIKLDANEARSWIERGKLLSELNRHEEASASFDKATQLAPNHKLAWLLRSTELGQLGKYDEALASASKLVEIDRNDGFSWGIKGLALRSLGRYDESLASYDKAIELGNKDLVVVFPRVGVLAALGRWDDCFAELAEALHQFSGKNDTIATCLTEIVEAVFYNIHESVIWQRHLTTLLRLCRKFRALKVLALALVRSISRLNSPMISDTAARAWLKVWSQLVGDISEFQLPLRLLGAAVRYRKDRDPRIFLELPMEERDLLSTFFKTQQPQSGESNTRQSRLTAKKKVGQRTKKKPRIKAKK